MIFTDGDMLTAYSLYNSGLTYDEVMNYFKNKRKPLYSKQKLNMLIDAITFHLNIDKSLFKSKKRDRVLLDARGIFYLLARKHTNCSLTLIGDTVERDHATVINGFKQIKNLVECKNKKIIEDLECIEDLYKGAIELKIAKEN
jgi:chromosomal replication initiation ATPase DnaA